METGEGRNAMEIRNASNTSGLNVNNYILKMRIGGVRKAQEIMNDNNVKE